jgi:hypothetical protein
MANVKMAIETMAVPSSMADLDKLIQEAAKSGCFDCLAVLVNARQTLVDSLEKETVEKSLLRVESPLISYGLAIVLDCMEKIDRDIEVDLDALRLQKAIEVRNTPVSNQTVKRTLGNGIRSKTASEVTLRAYSASPASKQFQVANFLADGISQVDFDAWASSVNYGISLKKMIKFFETKGYSFTFVDGIWKEKVSA